ncbi:MAG: transketolase, partial [Crocinitomicaceae bacterium]|nr:transketolase [Crocinitomicaceae bacterium]
AIEELTIEQYFASLYAHTDLEFEPQSAGRQMGGHFSTRNLDENGEWQNLMSKKNSAADISPTAGQMPRLLGLALASKMYRNNSQLRDLSEFKNFSNEGNEVAFGTIGDASTSEGPFWETINAAGVLQVPMVMSIWDDGFGISVPREFQTTKGSISEALAGMQRTKEKTGYEIFVTKGWDYADLCETYEKAVHLARTEHVPVLVHVMEVNQPQGHSTSGSHERYKSEERLKWETDFDCIQKFKEWILAFNVNGLALASLEDLEKIQSEAKEKVRLAKNTAWKSFNDSIKKDYSALIAILKSLADESPNGVFITKEIEGLEKTIEPIRKDIVSLARKVLRMVRAENSPAKIRLSEWISGNIKENFDRYSSHLHSESAKSALKIEAIPPKYDQEIALEDGRIILRDNYRKLLEKFPELLVFGEDAGKIGGVN